MRPMNGEPENFRKLSGSPPLPPRCVALTFDDGPGPQSADLARLLRQEKVPAMFFVLGENVPLHRGALDVIVDCGHGIALHGDEHKPFSSAAIAKQQLKRCRAKVRDYLGKAIWFRPPYGCGDFAVKGYCGPVGWDADGQDWEITFRQGQNVAGCVNMIVSRLQAINGGIVLLHDYVPASEMRQKNLSDSDLDLRVIEITSSLIARLRGEGFSFVGLDASVGST
jgi:peptidoglycan/xylan/chitin deacetylase (PgdA/CDA1 family)